MTGRKGEFLRPKEGRSYSMGTVTAVYKADGEETDSKYEISEWWLEPHTKGPGTHSYPEDDIFYVIEGTMTVLMDTERNLLRNLRAQFARQNRLVAKARLLPGPCHQLFTTLCNPDRNTV